MTAGGLRGVVAMDGPSGTGKSTVARRLALALRAGYLDTGAMYRAITLAVLRADIDPDDTAAVTLRTATTRLAVRTDPADAGILLDDEDVSAEIRGPEVTAAVSAVSAVPEVRELAVAEQRRIIEDITERFGGIVVEGRDIGSTVVPDAPLKVYLTASEEVRAGRRSKQDVASGRATDEASTLADVRRRDGLDAGRAASPMRAAEDAVWVDTSEMDAHTVLAELLSLVDERGMRATHANGEAR